MKAKLSILLHLYLLLVGSLFANPLRTTCNPDLTPAGTMVYWCCTDFGRTWTRIEVLGRSVLSLRCYETVVLEEKKEQVSKAEKVKETIKERKPAVYSARKGSCYHFRKNCPSGCRIRDENKIHFISPHEAQKAGRLACQSCQALAANANRCAEPRRDQVSLPARQGLLQPNN